MLGSTARDALSHILMWSYFTLPTIDSNKAITKSKKKAALGFRTDCALQRRKCQGDDRQQLKRLKCGVTDTSSQLMKEAALELMQTADFDTERVFLRQGKTRAVVRPSRSCQL